MDGWMIIAIAFGFGVGVSFVGASRLAETQTRTAYLRSANSLSFRRLLRLQFGSPSVRSTSTWRCIKSGSVEQTASDWQRREREANRIHGIFIHTYSFTSNTFGRQSARKWTKSIHNFSILFVGDLLRICVCYRLFVCILSEWFIACIQRELYRLC